MDVSVVEGGVTQFAVNIRQLNPESDAKAVTELWVDGLQQTVKAKWWPTRPYWRYCFKKYAEKSTLPTGDMGPNGQNLAAFWCTQLTNRCMLVSEVTRSGEDPQVVGCCGVVRGTSCNETSGIKEDETTFSIWKMSVMEEWRGKRIGAKLLKAAEDWARDNGCRKMRMITANPIASKFYQKQGYALDSGVFGVWLGAWHEKEL